MTNVIQNVTEQATPMTPDELSREIQDAVTAEHLLLSIPVSTLFGEEPRDLESEAVGAESSEGGPDDQIQF